MTPEFSALVRHTKGFRATLGLVLLWPHHPRQREAPSLAQVPLPAEAVASMTAPAHGSRRTSSSQPPLQSNTAACRPKANTSRLAAISHNDMKVEAPFRAMAVDVASSDCSYISVQSFQGPAALCNNVLMEDIQPSRSLRFLI